MPETRRVVDALGALTIICVAILVLIGLLCILYLFYFRSCVRNHGFVQLGYFGGPWVIRIAFIISAIWWSIGEVVRLTLLRQKGRVLNYLGVKWQSDICKGYIVSNLGFAEPCLFLTLVFLLRASLQKTDSGTLSQKWNRKTAGYVLLYCLPVFLLQLAIILVPEFNGEFLNSLPSSFTSAAALSKYNDVDDEALCTYPLLSTILLGLFATVLLIYLFCLGRKILDLVINKGLQTRVYLLVFSVSGLFPLRILFLSLSVLTQPEHILFEVFAFFGFLPIFFCAGVGIYFLIYLPVADCLALRNLQDIEAKRRFIQEHNDALSLIANQGHMVEIDRNGPERNSVTSAKRESISFRVMEQGHRQGDSWN